MHNLGLLLVQIERCNDRRSPYSTCDESDEPDLGGQASLNRVFFVAAVARDEHGKCASCVGYVVWRVVDGVAKLGAELHQRLGYRGVANDSDSCRWNLGIKKDFNSPAR